MGRQYVVGAADLGTESPEAPRALQSTAAVAPWLLTHLEYPTSSEAVRREQYARIRGFYEWCRSRDVYLNVPDNYFLSG